MQHSGFTKALPVYICHRFVRRFVDNTQIRRRVVSVLNFTAIDFETANSYRGSPCAVGIVKVRDGMVVHEQSLLVQPPMNVSSFSPFNIGIHGITPTMVANAPQWSEVLPAMMDVIDGDVVVAHNAAFDTGVIRDACNADGIDWPELEFLCTLVLSRAAFSLPSYRLPFVTEACGFPLVDHHNALADAQAVVGIIQDLAAKSKTATVHDLATAYKVRLGRMHAGTYRWAVSISSSSGTSNLALKEANPDADPDGYLYGRVVVFTGGLEIMVRQTAWDEVVRVGGVPEENTTKRTNVLVIGGLRPEQLKPGATLSRKAQKAFELQDAGQEIELMTEADFLQVIGTDQSSGGVSNLVERTPTDRVVVATKLPREQKAPRQLRRSPLPTDQPCSIPECPNIAAFKTRSKPTWCDGHITEILRQGGISPLESFTRPDDWRLTSCLTCGCIAHYRFVYTLDKNAVGEATCRACFWRQWALDSLALQGQFANHTPGSVEAAQQHANANGYEYLAPLQDPSNQHSPHRVECKRCGRISAQRLADIGFGCTCAR